MDYVPVYEDEVTGGGGGDSPEGYATVQVGAERVRLAGIQSAAAVRETIGRPVRAVGIVVPDERRVRRVQSKVEGWVEKLYANSTGQMVTKGQPLLEIYSPDLVAAQREYLLARAGVDRMKESPYEDARRDGFRARPGGPVAPQALRCAGKLHRGAGANGQGAAHRHAERAGVGLRDGQGGLRGDARLAGDGPAHRHRPLPASGSRPISTKTRRSPCASGRRPRSRRRPIPGRS